MAAGRTAEIALRRIVDSCGAAADMDMELPLISEHDTSDKPSRVSPEIPCFVGGQEESRMEESM